MPFNIVESEIFKDFLTEYSIIKAASDMPHRTTISHEALQDVVRETVATIKRVIAKAKPVSLSLTYDLWTYAHARNPYANTTAMFIDWKVISVNLEAVEDAHVKACARLE